MGIRRTKSRESTLLYSLLKNYIFFNKFSVHTLNYLKLLDSSGYGRIIVLRLIVFEKIACKVKRRYFSVFGFLLVGYEVDFKNEIDIIFILIIECFESSTIICKL